MKPEIRFYRTLQMDAGQLERTEAKLEPASGAVKGAIVGSVAGAGGTTAGIVVGGLAGKGVAEVLNPSFEREYWSTHYHKEPYHREGQRFDEYEGAYRTGYEGYRRHRGRKWNEVQEELRNDYERNRGSSTLTWSQAQSAVHAAWNRLHRLQMEREAGKLK